MTQIVLANNSLLNDRVLNNIYALRYKVFYERLKWNVSYDNGLEKDDFDSLDPMYMLAIRQSSLEGCWRILPTTGKYMLKDTFPQLLRGEVAPQDPAIFELSRFAVSASQNKLDINNSMNSITFEMIRNIYNYAVDHKIKNYVTVTSVGLERLLVRMGIPIRRFGDGRTTKIGKVTSVACWVDINVQFADAVYPNEELYRRAA